MDEVRRGRGDGARRRRRRGRLATALAATGLACLGAALPAQPHPNMHVEYRVALVFRHRAITDIAQSWTFDKTTSRGLMEEFDANGDGTLSDSENAVAADDTLRNLEDFRYFTYVWVDDHDVGALAPRHFRASVTGGRVTYTFANRLPKPVDPRHQSLKVEIFDREFYVHFSLAKRDPVLLRGADGMGCKSKVRPDPKQVFFGYVHPDEITVSCR